jgi:enediyne biosynthesis protein E7
MAEREGEGEGFSDDELRDQVMTILLAGHETTASSLAWTLYLLDRNPSVWVQVCAEVERVMGGAVPTEECLPRLVYTRMVYQESLRLYPPVWLIPRRSIREDVVGVHRIPADSDVLISPWVLHRREHWWPEPHSFEPNRFSAERSRNRPQYSYLPFGAGPRVCVGSSLATMEALLILAMVVQRFRLRLVSGHAVVPEPLLTLRFRHGIPMTLEPA